MSKRETNVPLQADAHPPRSPSPAAERMRRHRELRRLGFRCLTIQLRETGVDDLIKKGLLSADARNDPRAVREALHQFFDSTLNLTV